jgi:hypothetical protein
LILTCTVGLLSGIVEWDVVSLHHPQFHDPGIQYERTVETTYAIFEVHHILNWTYINIVREHADAH